MSLEEVRDRRLFDDARSDADRAKFYVRADEMGIEPSADKELMRALKGDDSARIQVVGPSGAGKTSLIVRVLGDLQLEAKEPTREVLVLRVGDRPENLRDSAAVIKLVLDTLAAQEFRFSNLESGVLKAAAADQTTATPAQQSHELGADARFVHYSTTLSAAFETRQSETNAAGLHRDLEDVLRTIGESGHRPVLVLDDTEKFVAPGEDGELDEESVANLYDHGVRAFADFDVDLVVASHPRFEAVAKVAEVRDRLGLTLIEVPRIDPELGDATPMKKILERRLERGGVAAPLDDVIDPMAVGSLTTLYHDHRSDLRSVLHIAHGAADRAVERGATRIEVRDIDAEVVRGLG